MFKQLYKLFKWDLKWQLKLFPYAVALVVICYLIAK